MTLVAQHQWHAHFMCEVQHYMTANCWLLLLYHNWDLHLSRMHSRCISKIICQRYCIHVGKLDIVLKCNCQLCLSRVSNIKNSWESYNESNILRCWVRYEWAMYSACRIRMQLQHWMGDATWKTNYSNAIISAQQLQWSEFKVEPILKLNPRFHQPAWTNETIGEQWWNCLDLR